MEGATKPKCAGRKEAPPQPNRPGPVASSVKVRLQQPWKHYTRESDEGGLRLFANGRKQIETRGEQTEIRSPRPRLPSVLQAVGWPVRLRVLLMHCTGIFSHAWHAPMPAWGFTPLAPPTHCLAHYSAHTLTRVCLPLVFSHLAAPMHRTPLARFIRRGDTTAADGGPSKTMQLGRAGWAGCGPVGKDEHTREGSLLLELPLRGCCFGWANY